MSYKGPERRNAGTKDPFLNYICQQLEGLNAKVSALHMDMISQKAESHDTASAVARIEAAFPVTETGTRDFDGHHYDHKSRIEAAKSWKDIWQDAKKKLFGGAAWALVLFLAYSAWESIKHEVKK